MLLFVNMALKFLHFWSKHQGGHEKSWSSRLASRLLCRAADSEATAAASSAAAVWEQAPAEMKEDVALGVWRQVIFNALGRRCGMLWVYVKMFNWSNDIRILVL